MALTRTKSSLCFACPDAKAGGTSNPQEVTSCQKGRQAPDVLAPPRTNAPMKFDPKDPETLGVHKDKSKGIATEEPKKTPSTKQPKKSKVADQPQQKRKGNHTSGHGDQTNSRGRVMEAPPLTYSSNHDEEVEQVPPVSNNSERGLSTNNLQRKLDAKQEKANAEKARPRGNDLRNHTNDRVRHIGTLLSSNIIFCTKDATPKPFCLINWFTMSSSSEQVGLSNTARGSSFARKKQKLVVTDFGMGGSGDHPRPPYTCLILDANRGVGLPQEGHPLQPSGDAEGEGSEQGPERVEIANDMETAPPSGKIMEVEALENLLAYRLGGEITPFVTELLDQVAESATKLPTEVWASCSSVVAFALAHYAKRRAIGAALLAERTTTEVGALVTELDQVWVANRDLDATNETLQAELLEAKFQIWGLLQANQQLEEESACQTCLIQNMKVIHDLYMETMGRMSGSEGYLFRVGQEVALLREVGSSIVLFRFCPRQLFILAFYATRWAKLYAKLPEMCMKGFRLVFSIISRIFSQKCILSLGSPLSITFWGRTQAYSSREDFA
uniref:Uncharacterized protein n=1 Tax=Cannabis sativa TaxID=3483 RepID=A0A803PHK1_CANSA